MRLLKNIFRNSFFLPASLTKLDAYAQMQEKRETRFCQVHQTIGIAKHPLRNELKKPIPHACFYFKQVLDALH